MGKWSSSWMTERLRCVVGEDLVPIEKVSKCAVASGPVPVAKKASPTKPARRGSLQPRRAARHRLTYCWAREGVLAARQKEYERSQAKRTPSGGRRHRTGCGALLSRQEGFDRVTAQWQRRRVQLLVRRLTDACVGGVLQSGALEKIARAGLTATSVCSCAAEIEVARGSFPKEGFGASFPSFFPL
jgi:hypothetical protein